MNIKLLERRLLERLARVCALPLYYEECHAELKRGHKVYERRLQIFVSKMDWKGKGRFRFPDKAKVVQAFNEFYGTVDTVSKTFHLNWNSTDGLSFYLEFQEDRWPRKERRVTWA